MVRNSNVIPLCPADGESELFNRQARVCAECGVRHFALFGSLDVHELDHIHVHIADLRLEPGQPLFQAQQPGSAVFTVRSGVVRLERSNEMGERRIVRLLGRGDLLGMESLLGQSYAADAVACTEVRACRIPRTLIEQLSGDQPAMTRDLMRRWQRALDDADEWLTELSSGTARHRMLRLLLKLSEYSEYGLIWLPARTDMGAMLDLTLETASRLVSGLRRDGILEPVDARRARLDMPALLAALRGETETG